MSLLKRLLSNFKQRFEVPKLVMFAIQDKQTMRTVAFETWEGDTPEILMTKFWRLYHSRGTELELTMDIDSVLDILGDYPKTSEYGQLKSFYVDML